MDECDASDLRMEQEDKIRMANHRTMMMDQEVSEECVECGTVIPKERRCLIRTDVCIDCANQRERYERGFR